jgi:uncharacterized membrane protein
MGRVVKLSVVDANGTGVAAQSLMVGDDQLATSKAGLAQVLLEDGAIVIKVNGVRAYEGPVADLKPLETFTTTGKRIV